MKLNAIKNPPPPPPPYPTHPQGRHTQVIHTAQSAFIPAIRSASQRRSYADRQWSSRLGARPMHRSTLDLGIDRHSKHANSVYTQYFQGSKDLPGVRRPLPYPSLFNSQWDIGTSDKMTFQTLTHEMFPKKFVDTIPTRISSRRNHFRNTSGLTMMDVTDMDTRRPDYATTYHVHHSRGPPLSKSSFVPKYRRTPNPTYDIVSGLSRSINTADNRQNFHRISGNRILAASRRSLPSLLG